MSLGEDHVQAEAKTPEIAPANEIGWAVYTLQAGRRIRRAGWNGNGMWLAYVPGDQWGLGGRVHYDAGHIDSHLLPWIGMKTADGAFVPWLASQTDILATDWELAE